jgi:FkbH-like protein
MFKGAQKSLKEANSFADYSDFLESLDLEIQFSLDNLQQTKRIAQMTNKTNQFNFRTVRYNESDIEDLIKSDNEIVITAKLQDKNTDYGVIGLGIIKFQDHKAFIDTLLMSCRALSRDVDKALLNEIVELCRNKGIKMLEGEYLPTPKNIIVADWFMQMNFTPVVGVSQKWCLEISPTAGPKWPSHIARKG